MIQHEIAGAEFLDLFAGSGAIGIEALSRGCRSAVFVEKNKKAAACIRDNLIHTKLINDAQVLETDVISALRKLGSESRKFDYIFMDPPYCRTGSFGSFKGEHPGHCGIQLTDRDSGGVV